MDFEAKELFDDKMRQEGEIVAAESSEGIDCYE
jgi:hypothetical protein